MSDTLAHVAEGEVSQLHPHVAGETKKRGGSVVGLIVRILLCLVFGLPLLFMIISSFKPDAQIFADLTGINAFLPTGHISMDNYTAVFDRVPFLQFMFNSVLISVCTVVLGLLVNSMA